VLRQQWADWDKSGRIVEYSGHWTVRIDQLVSWTAGTVVVGSVELWYIHFRLD
jgi:hypothetical protein